MSAVRRAPSIALSISLLVIASVAAATLVMFAITFSGPPPRAAPLSIEALARTIATGAPPPMREQRLTRRIEASEPAPRTGERRAPAAEALLARALDTSTESVRVFAREPQHPASELRGAFTAARRTTTGWQVVATAPGSWMTAWHWATLGAMAGLLGVLGLTGWWIARAISRPIARLADAAAQVRPGREMAIPGDGPAEVRTLAGAVRTMQGRLARQADERGAMLAAIAHDLGTPLSRVAFWIEQLPDTARDRAAADIEEMRGMLSAALSFARESRVAGGEARVDLGSLIEALADDMAATGQAVTVAPGPRVVVRGDPAALRRLFANLADNAIRYGGRAAIGWQGTSDAVTVTIDDAGPGFPATGRERLLEPFVRGDPSRNRATGGTGLGLAIARALAEAHGGALALEDGPAGGRVCVTLPAG